MQDNALGMVRIIHTIAGLQRSHGGTSRSVPALCNCLARMGHEVHLVAGRRANTHIQSSEPDEQVGTHWVNESPITGRLLTGRGFREKLESLIRNMADEAIIHDHGIWLPSNHATAHFARRNRIIRVISPRGMLSPWAMNHRKWKKNVSWNLFQHRDLQSAAAFHATSELEANEIRALGLVQPIAIVPNGIVITDPKEPLETYSTRRCLFLSRIHPKKGLHLLLDAWKLAGPPSGWTLVIAGTDENGHTRELMKIAVALGIENSLQFPGSVDDSQKWQLYRSAELFVLPSFSENFGIVVAEALAAGLPVITTTGTPWQSLHELESGWWVEPTVDAIAESIVTATRLPNEQLRAMGDAGSRWARTEFRWDSVANRMSRFYNWLAHGGSAPEFIWSN